MINVMISFAFKRFLNNTELGEKFLNIAIRAKLRELSLIPKVKSHKEQPLTYELPDFPINTQVHKLTNDQMDEIYL